MLQNQFKSKGLRIMPNAQRNGYFVYDSTETFGFLALLHSHFANAPFGSYNKRICGSLVALRSPKLPTPWATSHTPETLYDNSR